jgi:hypothetical protein
MNLLRATIYFGEIGYFRTTNNAVTINLPFIGASMYLQYLHVYSNPLHVDGCYVASFPFLKPWYSFSSLTDKHL